MPPIFKALITISVWLLFIKGCVGMIVAGLINTSAMLAGEPMPIMGEVACAVSSFSFILACVAAWLRKKVE
jgi:succinate dehydrogenase/fumarate reductase cytochrome b subunit